MLNNTLAIDTSVARCSMALRYRGQVFQKNQAIVKDYAQTILPLLSELLSDANAELSEIDCILYTEGPGSYTGLRIGCSVVQSICLMHQTPVIAVSSLALLAQGIYRRYGHTHVLATLNAHRQEVYWGYYAYCSKKNRMQAIVADQVSSKLTLEKTLLAQCAVAGNGWPLFDSSDQLLNNSKAVYAEEQPDATDSLEFANQKARLIDQVNIATIVPIYLRGDSEWQKQ